MADTQFTYGATTVGMEINPVHPRDWTESQESAAAYDSAGAAYSYDCGAPVARVETLTFPAVSWTNLAQLTDFIERTLLGALRQFTWGDMGTTRTARYKSMSYQQVSPRYWQINLTLEVQS